MFNPTINHIVLALLLATTIPTTLGHANIVKPDAAWHQPWPTNSFSAIVDADVLGAIDGATYGWGGVGAVKYIKEKMSTKYKTLKDLIMDKQKLSEPQATAECGLTIKDEAKRQTLPPELQFSNFGHPGPCEVWCDNTMLTHSDNCNTQYPDVKIAIDTSKCAGADRLTWYWLAVHSAPWQVYIDCVYLKGSTGTSNSTTNTYGPQPGAPVPAPTTVAPAPVPAPQPAPVPAPQPEPVPAPQPAPAPQTPTVVDDNSTPYQHKKCNPKY